MTPHEAELLSKLRTLVSALEVYQREDALLCLKLDQGIASHPSKVAAYRHPGQPLRWYNVKYALSVRNECRVDAGVERGEPAPVLHGKRQKEVIGEMPGPGQLWVVPLIG